nr:hypothetical protein [Streptomyces sp. SID5468]
MRLLPGGAGDDGDALPGLRRPRRRPSWAVPDPLDELAERLAETLATAVHPWEVAAVLESDGLSDEVVARRLGRGDLFAVAEELYARTERRPPAPPEVPNPWRADVRRCLLRGVVFALPGVALALAGPVAGGSGRGAAALVVTALIGWGWYQGLAHRAYLWLAVAGRRGAARCLLRGAAAGAVLGCGGALAVAGGAAAGWLAVGESVYLAAAVVLLVLDAERDLLVVLAPAVAGGAVLAVVPGVGWGPLVVLPVAPVLAVPAAVRRLRRAWRDEAVAGAAPALARSVPFGLFGLAGGVLTVSLVLGDRVRWTGIVLTLSMGPAEWLLHRYRAGAFAVSRAVGSAGEFRGRMGGVLARCLGGYVAVLVVPGAAPAVWGGAGVWPVAGLAALGALLWVALLLQAFGIAWLPALACAAAVGAQSVPWAGRASGPDVVRAVVCGGTAVVLAVVAHVRLGRVTAHR